MAWEEIVGVFKRLLVGGHESNSRILWNDATPEGSLAAPPGSLCLTATGAVYKKTTGSGNTGWETLESAGGAGNRFVGLVIDGSGEEITTGVKGFVTVPVTGSIIAWRLLSTDAAATAGDIVIDVWKDTFANYPPTNGESITNGNEPELSGANSAEDTNLADWTTQAVTEGDVLGFNVDSVADVTRVSLVLEIEPS